MFKPYTLNDEVVILDDRDDRWQGAQGDPARLSTVTTLSVRELAHEWFRRALTPREQSRILHLLIERISYDRQQGNLSLTFHLTGIKALAAELSDVEEHAA